MESTNYLEFIKEYCNFYCVCFQNPQKKESMTNRFQQCGLDLIVYDGVPHTDPRIDNIEGVRSISPQLQRLWSVTYGHLDMIQMFYDSGKSFGFFCEDDIVIHKDLPLLIPNIMQEYSQMGINMLLLGYMKTFKIESWMTGYESKYNDNNKNPYTYHNYPDDQWGVHLYMIDRASAKIILQKFTSGYADRHPETPFSPDWTISKIPNRALISPMYAVEDGRDSWEHYNHQGQYDFHMNTFSFNFIPDKFI